MNHVQNTGTPQAASLLQKNKLPPKVAAIHDVSCIGRCAATVILPVLSVCGNQVCPLPTALLSTHTGGYTGFTFLDLTSEMPKIAAHWETLDTVFDAVYSGFLGNPVAEGVYGDMGLLYASLFLIPMRVVMWSMGTSYFVAGDTDKKKVIKNVLTHPCLVAVYIGLFLMFTQIPLPGVVEKAVRSIGGCNSAITMFLVGTILAEVKLRDLVDGTALVYSVLRLSILPLIAWGVSLAVGMEPVATGVAVLMTGMPAGATAAIFAARYNSDAPFAARCVVLSTLFSIPLWCWVVG